MNFHELQEQLLMFTVATDILFGELSVGSQCLKALSNMMNRYKSIFKAKEHLERIPGQIPLCGQHKIPDLAERLQISKVLQRS